jgi:ribosome biogenesis GTPase A
MAKTRRLITENLKEVDLVIEILDARIPKSSENPEIARLVAAKPRLTLLSKSSLADPVATKKWQDAYAAEGRECIFYDCRTGEGISKIPEAARRLCAERLERYKEKGMEGRKLRAMIVGIPNVGKSSLINKLAANNKAKVENRPGVTLTKQWITTSLGIDLLDMPGILWPKFEDQIVGQNLAVTGAIRDEIMDIELLACVLCSRLYHFARSSSRRRSPEKPHRSQPHRIAVCSAQAPWQHRTRLFSSTRSTPFFRRCSHFARREWITPRNPLP